ncbi:Mitochondrial ribosomal protein subunit [Rhizoctonia solani]|uniref:Mitochondrial ribosomal protein subunit n=1 Tax=Rhizoctonia solani TaxID=456999 RepID=A0A8H7M6F3_9AGAM|nr:Mitochondrial ribosomal protein subunit [Rhizoctonia solani]
MIPPSTKSTPVMAVSHTVVTGVPNATSLGKENKVQDPLVSSSGGRGSARRNPVAFVSALDSSEGQTEWSSAEKDVRWLRRLEELGFGTRLNDMSAWSKRVGSYSGRAIGNVDSEFGSSESETSQQMSNALPNIQSMSERQFKSYIAKLRSQREEFHKFLQETGVTNEEGENDRSLSHMNHEAATQPTSNTLTPVPHPSGGLDYLNPTPLMSQLLFPNPVKGRYVQSPDRAPRMVSTQKYDSNAVVSIAGYNAVLQPDDSSATTQAVNWNKLAERDFSQPPEQASSDYRVEDLELYEVPTVVGKSRQGIQNRDQNTRARLFQTPIRACQSSSSWDFRICVSRRHSYLNADPISLKSTERWSAQPKTPMQSYQEKKGDTSRPMMELLDQLLDIAPPGKGKL